MALVDRVHHRVHGQYAVDRIAQYHDDPRVRDELGDRCQRLGVVEIGRAIVGSNHLAGALAVQAAIVGQRRHAPIDDLAVARSGQGRQPLAKRHVVWFLERRRHEDLWMRP